MTDQIKQAADLIRRSVAQGGKVLACGNGGSAAQASHLVAELMGRYKKDRSPIPAICLNSDTSLLTCIANDWRYEKVFSRQIEGLGFAGDVLCAFSTSWRSENIIAAVETAFDRRLALVGFGSGLIKWRNSGVECYLQSSHDDTARIQEDHLRFIHAICEELER